uniref:NADH dehydrogenase [ubiquinone] 1 alpha subcomplex subunit 11 n=1 Tax=Spermophilus dauricus TaxID=99837 RepID=A0A8C9PPG5_SPEDA
AGHFLFSHTPVIRDTPQCHCCLVEETKIDWPPSLCPTGLIWSAYSVTHRPPDSVLEGVARAGRYTFTAASLGAVFGITSCFSAQVRGKPDDPLNYFLGGCAGGLTLGARSEYPARPAPVCPCLGVTGGGNEATMLGTRSCLACGKGSGGRHICVNTMGRTLGMMATPTTPATWQAEAGGCQVLGQPQQLSKTLSQRKKLKGLGRAQWLKCPRFHVPTEPSPAPGQPP